MLRSFIILLLIPIQFAKLHHKLQQSHIRPLLSTLLSGVLVLNPLRVSAEPAITATVNMNIRLATPSAATTRVVTIGVYGNEAPVSSKVFLSLCSGENIWDVSLESAQVSRILKDERIDIGKFSKGGAQKQQTWMDEVGKVRIRSINVAENTVNGDINEIKHSEGGEVSMRKGGKSFELTIAPTKNPELDNTQIVIGKVLSGMDVINEINEVPTSREDALGSKKAFSSAGKGFDGRAKIALPVGKPLRKVSIMSCEVTDKASLASFLKF
jgi:cyclophilin family peptidyl-prolyl cis-trans isomerase